MKNITLSIDDKTYDRARIVAAKRKTSVSNLVRGFLAGLADGDSDHVQTKSWRELWDSIDAVNAEVGERPSRSRTYDNKRFPR